MRGPTPPFPRARGRLFGILALSSLVVACEARTIDADDIDQIDAASAEHIARDAGLIYPGDSVQAWYVDGTAVSQAAAFSAPSYAILSVSMQRSAGSNPAAIILTLRQAGDSSLPPLPSRTGGAHSPLYLVDGVAVTDAQAHTALGRSDIQSIEMIKPQAALAIYTQPPAANGVVKITTGGTSK